MSGDGPSGFVVGQIELPTAMALRRRAEKLRKQLGGEAPTWEVLAMIYDEHEKEGQAQCAALLTAGALLLELEDEREKREQAERDARTLRASMESLSEEVLRAQARVSAAGPIVLGPGDDDDAKG